MMGILTVQVVYVITASFLIKTSGSIKKAPMACGLQLDSMLNDLFTW